MYVSNWSCIAGRVGFCILLWSKPVQVCSCEFMCACVFVYLCLNAYMHACVYACMYISENANVHAYQRVCVMYACIRMCMATRAHAIITSLFLRVRMCVRERERESMCVSE
jgi:hypothetical protein